MVTSSDDIRFRVATSADVPAVAACRLTDPAAGRADPRMGAYLDGKHHPQQALAPRVCYVALGREAVIGYIAGHLTTRHGCAGEVQYLFVAPQLRRRRVGTALLRLLADWFCKARALKVCACVDADSPAAIRFYETAGASAFRRLWYVWDDISVFKFRVGSDRLPRFSIRAKEESGMQEGDTLTDPCPKCNGLLVVQNSFTESAQTLDEPVGSEPMWRTTCQSCSRGFFFYPERQGDRRLMLFDEPRA